ncbi:hypothetical protein Mucpa_1431 [Mucilaginibacter paludis DSM 18603]|uniref:Uncharacterized protein n=1 Tax=Mucilaginibacter paludis DSM 18603 TaxID=714943 RepID=H1XZA1_9SPHI|nr:hypothetical protein Mucpa_1431 [Mucilaginibacter paludis DSM 18603]
MEKFNAILVSLLVSEPQLFIDQQGLNNVLKRK